MLKSIRLLGFSALLSASFSLTLWGQTKPTDTYRQLELFSNVFEKIRSQYVESVKDQELIEAALRGMVSSLDPHSSYLTEKEFKAMNDEIRGFAGLGMQVVLEEGVVKVVSPIDDTPAFRAGIQSGDLVIAIDGEQVFGLTLEQAVAKLRGPIGTKVTITVKRPQQEPFDLSLVREKIIQKSVRSRLENGNIGYLRISEFTDNTYSTLVEEIKKLKEQSKNQLIGFVLDLRNNPGGLLTQAISVSDAFLEKGEIVSVKGRDDRDMKRFNATAGDLTDGLPLIVLINQGSASASEIVSGALQDHQRAIIMGIKSFGKGSVQSIIPLPGYGAVKFTTQFYYTPSGRSIQKIGIVPDIMVEQAKIETIAQGQAYSESSLKNSLNNPNQKPEQTESPTNPTQQGQTTPPTTATTNPPVDYQLQRATDLLRGLDLINKKPK